MIKELLQVVLFGQGGKADVRSIQEVRKNQAIPISAIILSITAVRCLRLLDMLLSSPQSID
jgi:hypothetical protein